MSTPVKRKAFLAIATTILGLAAMAAQPAFAGGNGNGNGNVGSFNGNGNSGNNNGNGNLGSYSGNWNAGNNNGNWNIGGGYGNWNAGNNNGNWNPTGYTATLPPHPCFENGRPKPDCSYALRPGFPAWPPGAAPQSEGPIPGDSAVPQ